MAWWVLALAGILVFVFTIVLSMAGLGTAFIVVPTFYWLGVPLPEAMAIGLLLNAISMLFASVVNIRNGLVVFKTAVPIAITAVLLSPLGVYSVRFVPQKGLLWAFAAFLLFAGSMMLFYKPKAALQTVSAKREIALGGGIGAFAGYLGGLLGVGGGNFIIPVLVGSGMEPKKASGTTGFVVFFASLAGFLGHASFGAVDWGLLWVAVIGAMLGAIAVPISCTVN